MINEYINFVINLICELKKLFISPLESYVSLCMYFIQIIIKASLRCQTTTLNVLSV